MKVRRLVIALLLSTTTLIVGPGTALAASGDISAFGGTIASPYGADADSNGNLYVASYSTHQVYKVTPGGTVTVYAGTGTEGYSGDGGPAADAELGFPYQVRVDADDNVYFSDTGSDVVRKVDTGGTITTVAGDGTTGYSGDGGPAVDAQLDNVGGLAFDSAGNLFIADYNNGVIRKVDTSGDITTFATVTGFAMDIDPDDNLYIADLHGHMVRKVTPGAVITTYAGTGVQGSAGDGGPATAATIDNPYALAVDGMGNVYLALWDERVRMVATDGTIHTVAGTGATGNTGDGGPATSATFTTLTGIAVDDPGNVYVVDYSFNRVRKIETPDLDGDGFVNAIDNFPATASACDFLQATIIGTNAGEVIDGTSGDDVIMGFGGPDTIDAMGGNDTICAGNGDDEVHGGDGNDRIFGEAGADLLYADDGIDYVRGGNGEDSLYGGTGKDRLFGDGQNDYLVGDPADDRLFGGSGDDELAGGGGDDRLRGGGGIDILDGGLHADGDDCIGETETNCEI